MDEKNISITDISEEGYHAAIKPDFRRYFRIKAILRNCEWIGLNLRWAPTFEFVTRAQDNILRREFASKHTNLLTFLKARGICYLGTFFFCELIQCVNASDTDFLQVSCFKQQLEFPSYFM
jgi:hypothetical protein